MNWQKIAEKILWLKIYQNRTLGLIALFTNASIIYLLINSKPNWWYLVAGFIVLITIGWLDVKVGLLSTELNIGNQQNPQLMEIITRLKRIEKKIK